MRMAGKGADPRPEKKIMLISGPPGFGKTTLCQVIASVAGYNLVEINARYYTEDG
jgi:replication-associated recombination protein RarA